MSENSDIKRLFFGLEAQASWPEKVPSGRIIDPASRHMTLAFLGKVDWTDLKQRLPSYPKPTFSVGPVGIFNRCCFLPSKYPRVVAWHIDWTDSEEQIVYYQKTVQNWLRENDYPVDEQKLLPHVTIARGPFSFHEWRKTFYKLPMMITAINLYESVGNLTYKPLWSHQLTHPFEEIEHTGDLAYVIRGENLKQISIHAQAALASEFPYLVRFINKNPQEESLDDVIINLNEMVRKSDEKVGCPFKAVSFHGDLAETSDNLLEWEMIIDV